MCVCVCERETVKEEVEERSEAHQDLQQFGEVFHDNPEVVMNGPAPLLGVFPHVPQLEEDLFQPRHIGTAVHLTGTRRRRVGLHVMCV